VNVADLRLGVVGLGYVGLPLAIEFSKVRDVIGFDINSVRVSELKSGIDSTLEVSRDEISAATRLSFTLDPKDLKGCTCFIITVPTPVDSGRRPDLGPLIAASELVGKSLKVGDVVIYESTVYPGCTEEDCVPILEKYSGLIFNKDFYCGYSPERVNPGDKTRKVSTIKKVTSGSTSEIANLIDSLYKEIILAGTHKASSIRVAEAAKVLENTQRDVNIALINEIAIILNCLEIDTSEVLEAAGTKWNFLPFQPGLVGGHCIGIDPYYLKFKAQSVGYHPEIISAVRRLNEAMPHHLVSQLVKGMNFKKIPVVDASILVMGLAFKENCPDLRNTKVIDVVNQLRGHGCNVDVYDPWVSKDHALHEYGISMIVEPELGQYDAIVLAVAHDEFKSLGGHRIRLFGKPRCFVYDVKNVIDKAYSDLRL
jgi:UDP-N-acetyl-D-galactosamine dehydrogenase